MAGAYDKNKYDLGLLKQDGTTKVGLMLVRKGGVPVYGEYDDPTLAQQTFTGEPDYSHFPPDREFQIGQSDWRAGMGQEFYDKNDKRRYWESVNCDLRSKGRVIAGPLVTPIISPNFSITCHAEFNDELYVGDGDILAMLNAEGDAFETTWAGNGNPITDLKVYNGYLFIAHGSDNFYSYTANGVNVTPCTTPADAKAEFFEVVDDILWKAVLPNELKTAIDPLDAGEWSGATYVGSDTDDIIQLMTESGQLFIRKENMPYYIDTEGNVKQLIPELQSLPSNPLQKGDVWQAKLYMPCGVYGQGLVEYDSGIVNWRSPSKFCPGNTSYSDVYQITHDEEWLFAAVRPGWDVILWGEINILAGRLETIEEDNETRWVWHPFAQVTREGDPHCSHLWVSSVFARRLYIIDGAVGAYFIPLPRDYANIDTDDYYDFTDQGYLITPWHHANFRGDTKAFLKLSLELENVNADSYVTAYYQIWEDDQQDYPGEGSWGWTKIGDYTSSNETKYIPINTTELNAGANPKSILIRFGFVFTIDPESTANSPALLSYDCRGIWYPTKRKIITCSVYCADKISLKDGHGIDTQTAAEIKEALEEANAATWPVSFFDIDGDEIHAKILDAKSGVVQSTRGKDFERVYNLTLMKEPLP